MGKVEKIVVLSVAFLIVVILVISTQGTGADDVQAADTDRLAGADPSLQAPRGEGEAGAGGEGLVGPVRSQPPELGPPGSGAPAEDPTAEPAAGSDRPLGEVLQPPAPDPARSLDDPVARSAGGDPTPSSSLPLKTSVVLTEPVYEVPREIPADWDLVTLAGLADHLFDPTLKVYTAQRSDTLLKIARRYYGDDAYVAALERNNEGLRALTPGHQLLLPVRAREILAEPADQYVVQDGESLWKIAKKVYGAGHRWGEIYEANRSILHSPDAVTPGTTLRIP